MLYIYFPVEIVETAIEIEIVTEIIIVNVVKVQALDIAGKIIVDATVLNTSMNANDCQAVIMVHWKLSCL